MDLMAIHLTGIFLLLVTESPRSNKSGTGKVLEVSIGIETVNKFKRHRCSFTAFNVIDMIMEEIDKHRQQIFWEEASRAKLVKNNRDIYQDGEDRANAYF
jgi:hypothetical protein